MTIFKETEIGLIPKEWEYIEFGSVINGGTRNGVYKSKEFHGTGVKIINMGELFAHPRLFSVHMKRVELTNKELELSSVEKGDLLFARRSLVAEGAGKCSIVCEVDEPTTFESSIIRARPNPEIVDSSFLYYFFNSKYGEYLLDTIRRQVAVAGITGSDLVKLNIPVPPLNEQIKIAEFLENLDQKIHLNIQMNRTLEAIGQAIFRHWFVHYEFPDENGQPYKSSGGEMVDSELGEIPAGWKISILKNYVNLITGCSYRSIDLEESDTALVTLKSVGKDGNFKQDGFKEYTGKFKEEQVIEDGDVVVAQTDLTQNADVLGKPVIVRTFPKYKKLIASLDLGIVRPKDSYLNKEFIFNALKTKTFHSHAVSYANGTTVLHLSKDAIPSYNLPIPNKSILNQFEKLITPINNQINNNNLESGNLSEIRDLLLPKLMSGKIRIKIPEEATVK